MKNQKVKNLSVIVNINGEKISVNVPYCSGTNIQITQLMSYVHRLENYETVYNYLRSVESATRKEIIANAFAASSYDENSLPQIVQNKLEWLEEAGLIAREIRRVEGTVTWEDGTTTKTSKKVTYWKVKEA